MQRLEQEIYALAGRQFNIASPRQLQDDPLRRAEAAGDQANGQDGTQHRRRRAGGVGPEASPAGEDRRVSAIRQAEGDLRRRPARRWSIRAPAGYMPRSTRWSRPRGGSARTIPTCRTSPCGPRPAAGFARPSCPARKAGRWWRPTTRRSSCGSWPITRPTSGSARPSSATRTFTPASPARSTTCPWNR